MKVIKLFLGLPVIALVCVIAFLSSQPYEKQDLRSYWETYLNLENVERWFYFVNFTYNGTEISVANLGAATFIEFFVRKSAHFSIYLLLGFLICLGACKIRLKNKIFWSFFLLAILATSDELYQSFNPNRTGLIEDVIVDAVGGLIGIFFAHSFYRWSEEKTKRKYVQKLMKKTTP